MVVVTVMDESPIVRRFDLDAQGLARVLGELEARIMQVVWNGQPVTVKDVVAGLGADAHFKTTMTVMNRLVEKKLLTRGRSGRAFVYEAVVDRPTFERRITEQVMGGLVRDFRQPAMAAFVDAADSEQLDELEALIRRRRDDEAR